jgi:hypothetical protein
MAYSSNGLSALAYANGFTLWHYRTDDDADVVDNVGYFNDASSMLRVGDFLFVNAGMDSVPLHGIMIVTDNSGGMVDVTNVNTFGSIDSD